MVKQVIVGAHYGLRGFLTQRVSAVVMALYTLLFLVLLACARPVSYFDWKAMFAPQAMKLATFLFFVSLFMHTWVGMRDILMDYARPMIVRLGLEVLVLVLLIAYAGWAIQILWSA